MDLKLLVEHHSSQNVNLSSPKDNQENIQNAYKTSETACFWGFSLSIRHSEMSRNLVEIGGYVAYMQHVCINTHSNYVVENLEYKNDKKRSRYFLMTRLHYRYLLFRFTLYRIHSLFLPQFYLQHRSGSARPDEYKLFL